MPRTLEAAPLATLEQALAREGLCLERLQRTCQAVVLFGSRAAGCAGPTSDWDILCIGSGRSTKRGALDLVWVEPREIESRAWLGRDLAGHVAAHGCWLGGEVRWDLDAIDFPQAARRKEARLARCLRSLALSWDLLGPPYQRKHAMLVRRDVQRCLLLQRGLPVPPSAELDQRWAEEASFTWFLEALRGLGAAPGLAIALAMVARRHG